MWAATPFTIISLDGSDQGGCLLFFVDGNHGEGLSGSLFASGTQVKILAYTALVTSTFDRECTTLITGYMSVKCMLKFRRLGFLAC